MGIGGLLAVLKPAMRERNIAEFSGKRIAVDGFCWLHRGAYSCAQELVLNQKTSRYVDFFMKRLYLLIHNNIEPIVIFDGRELGLKAGTNNERRKKRDEAKEKAIHFVSQGKASSARQYFNQAISISSQMVHSVVIQLKQRNIKYFIAPFEADAQLAYLSLVNYVDSVISEDSDLLVFGCKSVLYKLDEFGNCKEILLDDLLSGNTFIPSLNLKGFSFDMFQVMAIVAGCDYLPSIHGYGLKKAYKEVKSQRGEIAGILRSIAMQGTAIPSDYGDGIRRAIQAFNYQLVFDPLSNTVKNMTQPPEDLDLDEKAIGEMLPKSIFLKLVKCDIDPKTFEPHVQLQDENSILKQAGGRVRTSNTTGSGMTGRKRFKKYHKLPVSKSRAVLNYLPHDLNGANKDFNPPNQKNTSSRNGKLLGGRNGRQLTLDDGFLDVYVKDSSSGSSPIKSEQSVSIRDGSGPGYVSTSDGEGDSSFQESSEANSASINVSKKLVSSPYFSKMSREDD